MKDTPNYTYGALRVEKQCMTCGQVELMHPRARRCKPCAAVVKKEQQREHNAYYHRQTAARNRKVKAPVRREPIYNVVTVAVPTGEQFGKVIDQILRGEAELTL